MGWNKGGGLEFSELFDEQGGGGGGGLELAAGRMFLTFQ